ncbi:MAG: hypothetical protein IH898_14940, partial [Planctomycetes bacterium]|nr:hypothetical protein [Planctomycetota bacterium]
AVKEWEGEVVFLHQIVPGAADKSYGIHVAQLAGVPREVNERAKEILAQLEAQHGGGGKAEGGRGMAEGGTVEAESIPPSENSQHLQMTLFETVDHPLLEEIRSTDLNTKSPLEVQRLVEQWQKQLAGDAVSNRPR